MVSNAIPTKLLFQFIKFNLIGISGFVLGTIIYWLMFTNFQMWSWVVANLCGGILQFSLIRFFNKRKKSLMFSEE